MDEKTPFDLMYEAVRNFLAVIGLMATAIAIGLYQSGFFEALPKKNDLSASCRHSFRNSQTRADVYQCNHAGRR